MNHKAHFKGDIQVDGVIVGKDAAPVVSSPSWAMFMLADTETKPKPLPTGVGSDVYPQLKVVHSQGDDISLGTDKISINLVPGLYEVSLAYALGAISGSDGTLLVYMDCMTNLLTLGVLSTPHLRSGQAKFNEVLSGIFPIPAEDQWQLNFAATTATSLTELILTITRLGDLT